MQAAARGRRDSAASSALSVPLDPSAPTVLERIAPKSREAFKDVPGLFNQKLRPDVSEQACELQQILLRKALDPRPAGAGGSAVAPRPSELGSIVAEVLRMPCGHGTVEAGIESIPKRQLVEVLGQLSPRLRPLVVRQILGYTGAVEALMQLACSRLGMTMKTTS